MKKRHMGGHEISRQQWYWMPTTIFVLAILSIVLLVWVYQISERYRANSKFINAILDLRVRTATFHLWFEEAVVGGAKADLERALSDLDLATKLSGSPQISGGKERPIPRAQPEPEGGNAQRYGTHRHDG